MWKECEVEYCEAHMSSASRSVAPPRVRACLRVSRSQDLKFGSEACSEGGSTRTLSMSKKVNANENAC